MITGMSASNKAWIIHKTPFWVVLNTVAVTALKDK
jgi:hypothetical protein